ncbi:unnamed protein product [Miscanthus lutarioriparius]|uniref:Uncharacterized protein n=1 Tax=Miscanthus lutarioriparius TaxID=422564 RepID=A0A811MSV9_9POAL|nr:unnamed protein product [Miscanthus lutarioriparius]
MAEPEVEVAAATAAATAMETEAPAAAGQKREREEGGDPAADGGEAAAAKKPKVEEEAKEAEEAEEGKAEEVEEGKAEEANEEKAVEANGKPVKLGPKEFASAVEMFDYFFALLHSWTPQLEFNKYEQMVLEDLLKKGHAEPAKRLGQESKHLRYATTRCGKAAASLSAGSMDPWMTSASANVWTTYCLSLRT